VVVLVISHEVIERTGDVIQDSLKWLVYKVSSDDSFVQKSADVAQKCKHCANREDELRSGASGPESGEQRVSH